MFQILREALSYMIVVLFTLLVLPSGSLGSTLELNRDIPRMPCSFLDTVNLTDYYKYENGSYQYEDILIPKEYIATYNYEFRTLTEKVEVQPHVRGCVCLLKKCIKICCGRDTEQYMNKSCENPVKSIVEITNLKDSTVKEMLIGDLFAVQQGRPCKSMYNLDPSEDNYTIFENGTLFREYDGAYINKDSYCLSNIRTVEDAPTLVPLVCFTEEKKETTVFDKVINILGSINVFKN